MGLKKGQTNNRRGRPKGSKNRLSVPIKEFISSMLDANRHRLETSLDGLEPPDFVRFYDKLLSYVIPRQNTVDIHTEIKALMDNIDDLNEAQLQRLKEIIIEVKRDEKRAIKG